MSRKFLRDVRHLGSRGLCGLAVLCLWSSWACAEPLTVKEFNEKLETWKAARKDVSAVTLEVEGRVKILSRDRLTLEKTAVRFVSKKELPERIHKSQNVVVVGRLFVDPRTQETTFQIQSIRFVAGELEQFFERRRRVKPGAAEEWYALGHWASVRGAFYADDNLLKHAEEAFRHGIDAERKQQGSDAPERLLSLADKARKFGLLRASLELTHEAYRQACEVHRQDTPADLQKLAERLASDLPGALDKLPGGFREELIEDYQRRPLEVYAAAEAPDRRQLHRWLYAELQLQIISLGLSSDGSNGFEMAQQIDRLIPERRDVAETFRDRALRARSAEVERLTRTQVIELAEQYRLRKQLPQADQLVESWLTLRKQGLDPDDTEGLLGLADDYRKLLKRYDLADRLLIDGWIRNPKASDLQEQLEKSGYRLVDGRWLSEQEFSSRPEGKLEKAIRQGLVEPGMTAAQVRRSRGKPDSLARSATAGQVTEIWVYRMSDNTQVAVRFVKRAGQSEMTVAEAQERKPN